MMKVDKILKRLELAIKLMELHEYDEPIIKSWCSLQFRLDKYSGDFTVMNDLELKTIPGIGDKFIKIIRQLIDTDTHEILNELLSKTPDGVLDLLQIKGLGPKKVKTIWREMQIESVTELLQACQENRLSAFKGFGMKAQENIQLSAEFLIKSKGKYLPHQVEQVAQQLLKYFQKVKKWEVALVGDLPRQMEIVEKVEILIHLPIDQIYSELDPKYFHDIEIIEDNVIKLTAYDIVIHIVSTKEFLQDLWRKNASDTFLHSFNEKYKLIQGTEEEVFAHNEIPYIPAALREYEVPEAMTFVEDLIQVSSIKGAIHNHSTYSDGIHTLLQMAQECINMGMQYLVISDHSQYAAYANGLSYERILQQHQEIELLNKQLAPFKIFKSIECDILPDGSLDYSPSILSQFDIIVSSIHANLNMTQEKAMERLCVAIRNPYTSILGHPTGRLLLGRAGYPLDWQMIIEECATHDVVIELNANPRRLDIDWRHIQNAVHHNVKISINPDAHSMEGLHDIQYGVRAAQKAGLKSSQNLSSYSLSEIHDFIENQKRKRPIIKN
jgi:DNA polymerase (family 10)